MAPDPLIEMLAPSGGEKILDIGAGKGQVADRVSKASKGAEIYAVEPNERRVASMKRAFPEIKSSAGRAEALPFPDSLFDKAYATMAFHHFSDLDLALKEVARVLKPGGSFVILEVEPSSGVGRFYKFFGRLVGGHTNMMSEGRLAAKLDASGLFKTVQSIRAGSGFLIRLVRT